jgi:hypothetical protein
MLVDGSIAPKTSVNALVAAYFSTLTIDYCEWLSPTATGTLCVPGSYRPTGQQTRLPAGLYLDL